MSRTEINRREYLQRSANPISRAKLSARARLRTVVSKGWAERSPCVLCGKSTAAGHHPDYSRPYFVVWLCHEHHTELHRQIARGDEAAKKTEALAAEVYERRRHKRAA